MCQCSKENTLILKMLFFYYQRWLDISYLTLIVSDIIPCVRRFDAMN